MKKSIICLMAVALANLALATGDFLEAFEKHYSPKDGGALKTASCAICHVSAEDYKFNPFGADVKAKMKELGLDKVDEKVLMAVEAADSDKDGTPNGEEIKADTMPGDPASGAKPGVKVEAPAPKAKEFMPPDRYHGAIVHFPIALFIGGLLLDFFGMLRKDKTLLTAGWYNLVMASISAFGALGTGFVTATIKNFPYKGTMMQHLTFGFAATACMLIMVGLRVHRHEKMNVPMRVIYYVLAAAALGIVSWVGHLGGEMVYG